MEAPTFELVASSLRADAQDFATFLEALAAKLSGALPDATTVERGGRLRGRRVERIQVELGESRYRLEVAKSGRPLCAHARVVGGIVLKNEALALDVWIDALSRDLTAAAESSERSRVALERLLHD
jgi:hypothetical protein